MSSKSLVLLLAATVLAVVLAVALSGRGDSGTSAAGSSGKLLPGLLERVNEVAEVHVSSNNGGARLEQRGDDEGWVLADKGGYPAKFDVIKALVLDLAQAEIEARLTSKPEQYGKLGVADPLAVDSSSRRVQLLTDSGETLADVIVGDVKGSDRCFVRLSESAQALEISKALRVQADATNWIDRKVLELKGERVERCTVTHPDGEILEVTAAALDGSKWEVAGVPEGRELTSTSAGNQVATALSYVSLDDVAPAAEIDFSGATTARYRCRDGLVLEVAVAKVGETWWTHYTASFEPSDLVGPSLVSPSETEEGGDPQNPDDVEPADAASPETVQAEVEELDRRLGPWAFAISSWKAESLVKRLDSLLKPLPEPLDVPLDVPLDEPSDEPIDEPLDEPVGDGSGEPPLPAAVDEPR